MSSGHKKTLNDYKLRQTWNNASTLRLNDFSEPLYLRPPNVGIVIGTFAAVPYIQLQFEARERFYPHTPLLVHDDASPKKKELGRLCESHECEFEHNIRRQPPCLGDLSAFLGGILWARERGVDLLLKVSRRWIFRTNWVPSLAELAFESQYATLTSYTTSFNFGFRTECIALSVNAWSQPAILDNILQTIRRGNPVFVEEYLHNLARRIEQQNCRQADKWRSENPVSSDRNGYALWPLMGTDRCAPSDLYLWHDCHSTEAYAVQADEWGLDLKANEFKVPNQTTGTRKL